MILFVTPNPSLDLLYEADGLVLDDANRLAEPRRRPGGQGINAARAAVRLGGEAVAIALLGGMEGDEIEGTLRDEGTPIVRVRASRPTRLFIAVHDRKQSSNLLLNARGPERDGAEAEALLRATEESITRFRPSWVAGCGSLPPGFPENWYARLAHVARAQGSRIVIDCDVPPLRRAAGHCDLLVPNRYEAGRLLGDVAPETPEQAGAAARAMLATGPSLAAVTLGPDGAVLTDGSGVWHAFADIVPGVAVGAGDAFLAGLLLALVNGDDMPGALAAGIAAASGAMAATGIDILDVAAARSASARIEPRRIPI